MHKIFYFTMGGFLLITSAFAAEEMIGTENKPKLTVSYQNNAGVFSENGESAPTADMLRPIDPSKLTVPNFAAQTKIARHRFKPHNPPVNKNYFPYLQRSQIDWAKELHMSNAQADRLDKMQLKNRQETEKIMKEIEKLHDEIYKIQQHEIADIKGLLTEKQLPRYQKILKRLQKEEKLSGKNIKTR